MHIGSNLTRKSNLRKADKSSTHKVSFFRRFHCGWSDEMVSCLWLIIGWFTKVK